MGYQSSAAAASVAVSEMTLRAATMADVDAIHALIDEASQTTTVLPRSREHICEHLRDFMVAERGGAVMACGALSILTSGLAEIKSLVVASGSRGQGIGPRMVLALVQEARRMDIRRIFALTDNVPFFIGLGFSPTEKATLPHKVWNECIRCPKFLHCQEDAVDMILTAAS